MTTPSKCSQNTDPLKLIREGTSQDLRFPSELDPGYAPIDARRLEHAMVFARAYSKYLQFYGSNNTVTGNWQPFFSQDVSVQLAVAAVQDVDYYKNNLKTSFDFLKNNENQNKEPELKKHLGYLFSTIGTLAKQLDSMNGGLPNEIALKRTLQNLIQNQLAPAFRRLTAYYKADILIVPEDRLIADVEPDIVILGETSIVFSNIYNYNFSKDWITNNSADWNAFTLTIKEDSSVYGSGVTVFERINHIATHNLFTSIFDQFLKVFARTVSEAKSAIEKTLTDWDRHEPHYALFLAFLRLFAYARDEMNTLTRRHLDFYYHDILQFKEKAAVPSKVHLLMELAKQTTTHLVQTGELFKAGKDDLGIEVFFANDREAVVNQAKVSAIKTLYRHGDEKVGLIFPTDVNQERLYASPVSNSADGLGAVLTSADQSWHPFHNKIYQDGLLAEINMPAAEIGFALASHYLLMAEGSRYIVVWINVTGYGGSNFEDFSNKTTCLVTAEEGWVEKTPTLFLPISADTFMLYIEVDGNDAPITPYLRKNHGYTFETDLPVLLVKLKHDAADKYAYNALKDIVVTSIVLEVYVYNLKTLAVSNDFGPVDTSKPFQPYGASPVANNALVIGSKEAFQKSLTSASVNVEWLSAPAPYSSAPQLNIDFLKNGQWIPSNMAAMDVDSTYYPFTQNLDFPVMDKPDLTPNDFYNTASRRGFARLKLNGDFGQSEYQTYLLKYLRKDDDATEEPGAPPVGPSINAIWMDYSASQSIPLDTIEAEGFDNRQARYFHLAPFGQAEQHPYLNNIQKVYLLPQFGFQRDNTDQESKAELYIGVAGLRPPQNLSLLFQVADGTADPLSKKPDPHIHWSFLGGNQWLPFDSNEVEDQTGGLLDSGIITFAIPKEATVDNTLFPAEMLWLRAAVSSGIDAVCRLLMIAAQAIAATFSDNGNDPSFPSKVLPPGVISKLDQPDTRVKKVTQPFANFGGRAAEKSSAFYTRVSERLRHKDRAIALWDYERLVLEAFPEIYQVKCLNHTHYEPDEGIYRELAPGHVTIVTIPNQQFHNLRDPLRPFTSLGLLEEIAAFLRPRMSCFVKPHVKNPLFEEVRTAFKVRLSEGKDESFYLKKLEEDITRFLSPWAFPGGGSPSFGGKIYKSVLINFVEELPYVDYVTDFQLFHTFPDENDEEKTVEKIEVESSRAVSLIVSTGKHTIDILKPAEIETSGEKCPCEA